jgi:hypothetical protein
LIFPLAIRLQDAPSTQQFVLMFLSKLDSFDSSDWVWAEVKVPSIGDVVCYLVFRLR